MEDSTALQKFIETAFRSEMEFKIVDGIVNGTGAGQPLGFLNSGALISITKESGQSADTIVQENLSKAYSRLLVSKPSSIAWLINRSVLPQLMSMSLAVGVGGVPVFMPANGASGKPYDTLMGYPVIPIEQCPVLGDLGDICLTDLSGIVAIDKGGMKTDYSMHVRFLYDENTFRVTYRFDSQPILASSITPFTAGATTATETLSHFVCIGARD